MFEISFHFVDYPWVHLDIAGPAYADSAKGYRVKGATGYGVRLLIDYLQCVADSMTNAVEDDIRDLDEE